MKNLRAGILLSRTPIIAKQPSKFESAYFRYQDQLERRLMWTFPWYFYFKRGTLAQRKFDSLQKGPQPRHKGVYYPKGIPDVKHNRERRYKQIVNLPSTREDGQSSIDFVPRTTKEEDNVTSLARKLDSTLFLCVQEGSKWKFPAFEIEGEDALHEAAEKGLRALGGENINTWTVSNTPTAVIKGEKPEFLVKSHILHGQFAPKNGVEFGWFTKEELRERLEDAYFSKVECLL